jgi:hypothetical protein
MKWNIVDQPAADKGNWHEWYAWFPVKTEDNSRVWLEKIVRKQTGRSKNWGDWMFLDFFNEYTYKESIFQIIKDNEK